LPAVIDANQSMSIRRFLEGGFASRDIRFLCRILSENSLGLAVHSIWANCPQLPVRKRFREYPLIRINLPVRVVDHLNV
jgi:hypothetical protein